MFVYTVHTEATGEAVGREKLEFQSYLFLRYVFVFVFFSKDSTFME